MFATIRKHQKWLWFIVVAGVIISFVVFFSPENRVFHGRGEYLSSDVVGSINGRPLTRQEYFEAAKEAQLRYKLYAGDWPDESNASRSMFQEDREIHTRLLLNEKMRELGVRVGPKGVTEWIANAFRDPRTGEFRPQFYDEFVRAQLTPRRYTDEDVRRFVEHEVGIQHLIALFGLSGELVTPQEAAELYRRANEMADTQAAFFWSSNFLSKVTITPAELSRFYTNHSASYRIPERIQVSYVAFAATNYLAEAQAQLNQNTNLNKYLEATYQQRGTNMYPGMTPEAAKGKIAEEARKELAIVEARRKANDFTDQLFELKPKQAANLEKLAAAKGLIAKVTDPFTRFEPPPGLTAPPTFAESAFVLTPEEPFPEQPIVGEDAVYVISFKKKIPSELPSLDQIRPRVTEDFRRNQSQELARKAGEDFYRSATNALAHGTNFQAAAAQAKVSVTDLPPFSQKTPVLPEAHGALPSMKAIAFRLSPGEISNYTQTRDGGFVLQLQRIVPADPARIKEELPEFTTELRRRKQVQAFDQWLQKQAQETQIVIQGKKQQQQKM